MYLLIKIIEELFGGRSKQISGKSLRGRVLFEFVLSIFIINFVVNFVVVVAGDFGQFRVYYVRFSGIIFLCIFMRITDIIEQLGGCVVYFMD